MKKFIFLIILFSSFSSFSQTEKQTIDSLNSMLSKYLSSTIGDSARMEITILKSNKRSATLEFKTYYDNELFVTEKFNTRDIDGVKNISPLGASCIQIISSKSLIQEKFPDDDFTSYKNDLRILLDTDTEEIQKIKKALEHFLTQKGAKFSND